PQGSKIANVKPPVGNHWIRKRLLIAVRICFMLWLTRRSEAAVLPISFSSRYHKSHISTPTVNIQKPLSIRQRRRAQTFVLPHYLARGELNSHHLPTRFSTIKVVTDQHRTPKPFGSPRAK